MYLLIEWEGQRENIWLEVMTYGISMKIALTPSLPLCREINGQEYFVTIGLCTVGVKLRPQPA